MLIDVDLKTYNNQFPNSPNPFISSDFIELNRTKVDKIIRLLENKNKVSIGLVAGIKDNILLSPFSAPFGGFHFRNDNIYITEIEVFIDDLLDYARLKNIEMINLTLPPSIYHLSFNTKLINILIRKGFVMDTPDITNWIDLTKFGGMFTSGNTRNYYRQAVKNGLTFKLLDAENEKMEAYEIFCENRKKFGRPIFMTYNDLKDISKLWPVDFFGVKGSKNGLIAGGVFYRGHKSIVQGIFWGDSDEGRPQRALDYLSLNAWNHYKNMGFEAIDCGISTESGVPNEGLLRFKESHNCYSSLKFSFCWKNGVI